MHGLFSWQRAVTFFGWLFAVVVVLMTVVAVVAAWVWRDLALWLLPLYEESTVAAGIRVNQLLMIGGVFVVLLCVALAAAKLRAEGIVARMRAAGRTPPRFLEFRAPAGALLLSLIVGSTLPIVILSDVNPQVLQFDYGWIAWTAHPLLGMAAGVVLWAVAWPLSGLLVLAVRHEHNSQVDEIRKMIGLTRSEP